MSEISTLPWILKWRGHSLTNWGHCTSTDNCNLSAYKNIQILLFNFITAGPGTITFSQSSPITVLKGNQFSITCSASGNPPPTYNWSKGGTTIFNGGTLLLSNAAKTDSGVYTCTGTNSEGTNSGQFTVNVQCKILCLYDGIL